MYVAGQGNFLFGVPQPVYHIYSAPLNETNLAYLFTFNDVCNLSSVELSQLYSQYGMIFANAPYVGYGELPDNIIRVFTICCSQLAAADVLQYVGWFP